MSGDMLRALFESIDINGDGVISRSELRAKIHLLLGTSATEHAEEAVEAIMEKLDTDHSGDIDFGEFSTAFGPFVSSRSLPGVTPHTPPNAVASPLASSSSSVSALDESRLYFTPSASPLTQIVTQSTPIAMPTKLDLSEGSEHVHSPGSAAAAGSHANEQPEDLQTVVDNLRVENTFLEATAQRLRNELRVVHESNATLSDELEKAATATKEMRKKLVGMDKTREQTVELNEQVERLKEQVNTLHAENTGSRKKLRKLQEERESLEKTVSEQSSLLQHWQQEYAAVKQQLQKQIQLNSPAITITEAQLTNGSALSPVPASPRPVGTPSDPAVGHQRRNSLVAPISPAVEASPAKTEPTEEITEDPEDSMDWFEEREMLTRELEQCNALIQHLRQENEALREQATTQQLANVQAQLAVAAATAAATQAAVPPRLGVASPRSMSLKNFSSLLSSSGRLRDSLDSEITPLKGSRRQSVPRFSLLAELEQEVGRRNRSSFSLPSGTHAIASLTASYPPPSSASVSISSSSTSIPAETEAGPASQEPLKSSASEESARLSEANKALQSEIESLRQKLADLEKSSSEALQRAQDEYQRREQEASQARGAEFMERVNEFSTQMAEVMRAERAKLTEANSRAQSLEQQLAEALQREEEARTRLTLQQTSRRESLAKDQQDLLAYRAKEEEWAAEREQHAREKLAWQHDLEAAHALTATVQKELAALKAAQASLLQQQASAAAAAAAHAHTHSSATTSGAPPVSPAHPPVTHNKYSPYAAQPADDDPLSRVHGTSIQAEAGQVTRRGASEATPLLGKEQPKKERRCCCCCNVM